MDPMPNGHPHPEHTAIYLRTFPPGHRTVSLRGPAGAEERDERTHQAIYVAPRPDPDEHPSLGAGRWQVRRVELLNGARHDYVCCVHQDLDMARLHIDWCVVYCSHVFAGSFAQYRRLREQGQL